MDINWVYGMLAVFFLYHFVVDVMEVDLAHFLHHIFVLESDEAKAWKQREEEPSYTQHSDSNPTVQSHTCLSIYLGHSSDTFIQSVFKPQGCMHSICWHYN